MKDITEYLKRQKVKEAGFDVYDEGECLKALSIYSDRIQYIRI